MSFWEWAKETGLDFKKFPPIPSWQTDFQGQKNTIFY